MKKIISSLILGITAFSCLLSAEHFTLNLSGNFLIPSNRYLREGHQRAMINPEFKLSYRFSNGLNLWGGYGFVTFGHYNRDPYFPYDEKPTGRHMEHIVSIGIGYRYKFYKTISYVIDIGLCGLNSQEVVVNGEKRYILGFRVDGSLVSFAGKNFYTGFLLGYLNSFGPVFKDDYRNENYGYRFGGLKFGVIMGIML